MALKNHDFCISSTIYEFPLRIKIQHVIFCSLQFRLNFRKQLTLRLCTVSYTLLSVLIGMVIMPLLSVFGLSPKYDVLDFVYTFRLWSLSTDSYKHLFLVLLFRSQSLLTLFVYMAERDCEFCHFCTSIEFVFIISVDVQKCLMW